MQPTTAVFSHTQQVKLRVIGMGIMLAWLMAQLELSAAELKPLLAKSEIKSPTTDSVVSPASSELLVFLQPGESAEQFAQQHGLQLLYPLKSADGYVFGAASAKAAAALAGELRSQPVVKTVELNERTQNTRTMFVPNDPYYPINGGGVGQPGQWHLNNSINSGRDVRITGAWNNNLTGQGVIIGIVDDGFETAHPDLAPNYSAANSFNFGVYSGSGPANDPNPRNNNNDNSQDRHGVAVAGVAAARGGNGIGVTGAAPFAGLAGLRVDFVGQTTAMFVDATLFNSSGANTNIKIKNHSYGIDVPFISTPAERAAFSTSAAAGTIHLIAAGNERGAVGQDSGKQHNQSNPDIINVAALGSNGVFASYSSFGSNVFVTAPSSTAGGFGITTTDRTGSNIGGYNYGYNDFPDLNYTDVFGGTSSATPLVAGVMALVKQAQPNLNVRMAKHLLARTSDVVDAADATAMGGWVTNAAGYRFNPNYGFGLIDATELTQQSVLYSGVTALQVFSSGVLNVGAVVPDNNLTGINRSTMVNATGQLEEVLATLNLSTTYRGDLEAFLTSPAGTTSRLFFREGGDSVANLNWTFTTNAFWGESPAGNWTIQVRDVFAQDIPTWNNWQLDLRMGTLVAVPEPSTWAVLIGLGMTVIIWRKRTVR